MTHLTVSDGIANPMPMLPVLPLEPEVERVDAIAVLMPIILPSALNDGPPEFPEFIAASIWTALVNTVLDDEEEDPDSDNTTGRLSADTTPVVAVFSYPSGFPIAITSSPTARFDELAKLAAVRLLGGLSIFSTARSVVGSVPTTLAPYISPLDMVTTICPLLLATWLFVTIYPFLSMITPDPITREVPVVIVMETTEGATFLATAFHVLVPALPICVDVLPLPPVEEFSPDEREIGRTPL